MTTENPFSPIQQRLMEFIRLRFQPGYNHYNVSKLVGDASSRQYYRYVTDSGTSYILAAYPEPFDPLHFSYQQIYELLRSIEIPVPEIVEMDGRLGIVLQEDLGNEALQKTLINAGDRDRVRLLKNAIDHILVIQAEGAGAFRPEYEGFNLYFDVDKLNWEFRFFHKHYLKNYRRLDLPSEESILDEYSRISRELAAYPTVLCHRDFHVRNMMLKNGVLFVIDFQDARWGPPSYDVASLLKDSLDLDLATVDLLIDYYLGRVAQTGMPNVPETVFDETPFLRQFHLMCIQRLLKALGTYAYQIIVRENFIYEQYMAGSLHRALLALQALPEFPCIEAVVEGELFR